MNKSWITPEFARMDNCLDRMVPSDLRVLVAERDAMKEKLCEIGVCPDCLQEADMDEDGPFSHCKCSTGEDYAKRPLQRLQLLER